MKKLVGIKVVEPFPIYDISVNTDHCFELDNGIIAHNSIYPKTVIPGGCVEKGTKIILADGTLRNIEDIIEGDYVMTQYGPKEVTDIWNPETLFDGTPECVEIEFDDGYKFICSINHPILTSIGWIQAQNITQDHDIMTIS